MGCLHEEQHCADCSKAECACPAVTDINILSCRRSAQEAIWNRGMSRLTVAYVGKDPSLKTPTTDNLHFRVAGCSEYKEAVWRGIPAAVFEDMTGTALVKVVPET